MKVTLNREYAVTSADVRDINCHEMRQMHELNTRIVEVLDSHKPEAKKKKYINDNDLFLMHAILSTFTKGFSILDAQTSAFDEFLKEDKPVEEKELWPEEKKIF